MSVVNASSKKMGLPLVTSAARLREWRGYAPLSGLLYELRTGYVARSSHWGSRHLRGEITKTRV